MGDIPCDKSLHDWSFGRKIIPFSLDGRHTFSPFWLASLRLSFVIFFHLWLYLLFKGQCNGEFSGNHHQHNCVFYLLRKGMGKGGLTSILGGSGVEYNWLG